MRIPLVKKYSLFFCRLTNVPILSCFGKLQIFVQVDIQEKTIVNMQQINDLNGKVAIITGGSGVLGEAMATGLALAGVKTGIWEEPLKNWKILLIR
jgi:hypothetical protein